MLKILFIGCVESSETQLRLLLENKKNIVGVITKEKSSFNSDFCDLSDVCREYNVPYIYVKNINDPEAVEFVNSCQPDIGYCFGWSQLIHKEILDIPPQGIIGTHPAALPNNRGRHPLIWAMALGLKETASSFFVMNEEADFGAIVSQEPISIEYTDYARDLYDKVNESECRQILRFTDEIESGTLELKYQDANSGNSWRKRSASDGVIDWRMSSRAIYNLIRALSKPYVGASFYYQDREIKVWKSEELVESGYENIEPGKVIKYNNPSDFVVKAYDNLVHITDCDGFDGKVGEYL